MPTFKKMIVSEGTYHPYNPITRKKMKRHVSKEELQEFVDTANQMKLKGLKIPAPWKHDANITSFSKIEEGDQGLLEDSSKNAGFWDKIEGIVNPDTGKYEVYGEVDVPGDASDANTPAGKVGTSVRDTSIYLRKDFEDGAGNKWPTAVMHIALVTHPIENGQPNFELTDPNDSYLAMSEFEDESSLSDLISKLKKVCKLYIPPNTSKEDFPERLMSAVSQLELSISEELDDSVDNKTYNAEPVIMSGLTKEAIAALVATNAINPATKKPFVEADFQDAPAKKDDSALLMMSSLTNVLQGDRRKGYRNRIDTLVETGRVVKTFADTHLYPQADNYNIELAPEGVKESGLDTLLMSLESMPAPNTQSHKDYTTMDNYLGGASEADEAELERIADAMVSGNYV